MLTGQELNFLCGEGARPPSGVVTHDWGDGVVYYTEAEAKARGLGAMATVD